MFVFLAACPREAQRTPGYPLQAPSACQRAEFIPSAAEGGFPLLSLAGGVLRLMPLINLFKYRKQKESFSCL
jgi:hypothetical protein